MKKLLLLVTLLVMSASSYAFNVHANVFINNRTAKAIVYNNWNSPIVCSGKLRAVDAYGNWTVQRMRNVTIFPGQYSYIYANVHGHNNYFVDARAKINCFFR